MRTSKTSKPRRVKHQAPPGRASSPADATGSAHLLVLVLLQVARRHQALGVDVSVDLLWDQLRVWVQMLHFQEGQDVLHFHAVGAVGHGLALGGQAAGGHPAGVLRLLPPKTGTQLCHSRGGATRPLNKHPTEPSFPSQPQETPTCTEMGRNPTNVRPKTTGLIFCSKLKGDLEHIWNAEMRQVRAFSICFFKEQHLSRMVGKWQRGGQTKR